MECVSAQTAQALDREAQQKNSRDSQKGHHHERDPRQHGGQELHYTSPLDPKETSNSQFESISPAKA
jgi:hypothetical protein